MIYLKLFEEYTTKQKEYINPDGFRYSKQAFTYTDNDYDIKSDAGIILKRSVIYTYIFNHVYYYYDIDMVNEYIIAKNEKTQDYFVDYDILKNSISEDFEKEFRKEIISDDLFENYTTQDLYLYFKEYENRYYKYGEVLKNWKSIENKYEYDEDFFNYLTNHIHSELFFTFMFDLNYQDISPFVEYIENVYGNDKEIREIIIKKKALDYYILNKNFVDGLSDSEMIKQYLEDDYCYNETDSDKIATDYKYKNNAYHIYNFCDCDETDFFKKYDFQKKLIKYYLEFELDKPYSDATEEEKKHYLSSFLLEINEKIGLNTQIKKEFKPYMFLITASKYKI